MSVIGYIKHNIFIPVIKFINTDYKIINTENSDIVEFVTIDGNYYISKKDADIAEKIRQEIKPYNKHSYERGGTKVKKGDVVVDVGSGDGSFALKASAKASVVYAFEPNPMQFKLLHMSFDSVDNIKIVETGLSNKAGTCFISNKTYWSKISDTAVDDSFSIEIDTLDNVLYDKTNIDYLKVDIEGEEVNMLLGAEKIIKRDKPKIAICVYHDPSHPEQIKKLLKEWVPEYKIKIIKNFVLHAYL